MSSAHGYENEFDDRHVCERGMPWIYAIILLHSWRQYAWCLHMEITTQYEVINLCAHNTHTHMRANVRFDVKPLPGPANCECKWEMEPVPSDLMLWFHTQLAWHCHWIRWQWEAPDASALYICMVLHFFCFDQQYTAVCLFCCLLQVKDIDNIYRTIIGFGLCWCRCRWWHATGAVGAAALATAMLPLSSYHFNNAPLNRRRWISDLRLMDLRFDRSLSVRRSIWPWLWRWRWMPSKCIEDHSSIIARNEAMREVVGCV